MSFIVRNPNAVAFTLADADIFLVFAPSETGVDLENLFSWEKLYRSATAGALLSAINSGNLIRRNSANTADVASANAFDDSIWRWQLTKSEKESLVGTEGTPSPSNPFVTSDDNRLTVENLLMVKKNPGIGEFLTINDALNSIADATANNQYEIFIGPGVYVETTIFLKPFVHLTGTYSTFIEPSDPDDDIIVSNNAAVNIRIKFAQIRGATGTGAAAVRVTSGQLSVLNVVFGNNYYLCSAQSSAGLSFITLSNIAVNSIFNTGFRALATGGTAIVAIASSSINLTVAPLDVFHASGPGSSLILSSSLVQGAVFLAGTNGVRMSDGASLKASGIGFGRFAKGVFVENIGASPAIQVDASNFDDCTIDADIAHASATGFLSRPNKIKSVLNETNSVYIPNENQSIITVAKRGANFQTIGAALAHITDNTSTNTYVIQVGPGLYVEDTLTMKEFVDIVGVDRNITIIEVDDPSKDVITMVPNCYIANVAFQGATDVGSAAIRYNSISPTPRASIVSFCNFGSNHTLVSVNSSGLNTARVTLLSCALSSSSAVVNTLFDITATSHANILVSQFFGIINVAHFAKATGAAAIVYLLENAVGGSGVGTFVEVSDGATAIVRSNTILNFDKGIEVLNVGLPSTIQVADCDFSCVTNDLLVSHPGTTGYFTGVADNSKVVVDPASPILVRYTDFTYLQGSVSIGSTYQGTRHDRIVNISKLTTATAILGVHDGGELSYVSGTTIMVTEGHGFLLDQAEDFLKEIVWPNTNLVIPANTTRYIYVNDVGVVSQSAGVPSAFYTLFLGRASVDATGLLFIEQSQISQLQHSNKLEEYTREAVGPIYSSGSLLSESVTPLQLNISSGIYFYGTNKFTPSGATDAEFITYLRNGSGGWIKTTGVQIVPDAWDDDSGTPVPLGTDKYAKHSLYIVGDGAAETYMLVHSQMEYDSLIAAEGGNIPLPPSEFESAVALIATIIIKNAATSLEEIRDERPIIGFKASGISAATVHGNLLGLLEDDHPQYLLVKGTRAMTGTLDMGTNSISNVNLINTVSIQAHASRHQPNGADPIPTAAANTITATAANGVGTSNSLSRADHIHAINTGMAVTLTPDATNATGTSASLARADHVHTIATAAPSAVVAGGSNVQGIATSFSRADHVHAAATAAPSTSLSAATSNLEGVSTSFSRADHVHNLLTGTPSTITLDAANAPGTSASLARADHIHNLGADAPVAQTPNQANTEGTSNSVARADHVHAIATAAPVSQTPDATNADGVATSFSKSDHVHNIPTATAVSIGATNAQGVAATFSRADHIHQGVHGIRANTSSYNYGDVTLQAGLGIAVVDAGSGILTISAPNSLYDTVFRASYPGTGLDVDYTGGIVRVNDTVYTVVGGSISLSPSESGEIYVGVSGTVGATTGGVDAPDNSYPFARYTTDGTSVTALTDRRTWIGQNLVYGGTSDISIITPDTTRDAGVQNRYARADHTHGIAADAPSTSLSATTSNAEGVSTSFARADHVHSILTGTVSTQTPDQANAAGASANLARADHVHNIPTAAAVGLDAASTNTQGAVSSFARADHTHAISTGIVGDIVTLLPDATASAGVLNSFARADHGHAIACDAPTTSLSATTSNAEGVGTAFARNDHTHAILTGVVSTQNPDQANAAGTSANLARADHVHNIPTAVAVDVAATNAQGASTSFARADHTHRGIRSLAVNAGTQRFGDINLRNGNGVTVVDDGAGNFTFDTTIGPNELVVTNGGGLIANYTAGLVLINGAFTSIAAGNTTVTASITNGFIYVTVAGSVSSGATLPDGAIPLALFTSDLTTITALSNRRVLLRQSNTPGASGDIVTIQPDATALAGTSERWARADHRHAIDAAAAVSLTPDQANAEGASTSFARANHVHNVATAAPTTALSATTTNAQGAASTFARSDHSHAILTGTVSSQTPDQANATGTSANLARADHIHNIATAAASSLTTSSTNTQGAASSFARSDHTHAISLIHSRVASTSLITTTSTTYVVLTGQTLTPVAGTYLALARAVVTATSNNRTLALSIFVNGAQVTDSEVTTFVRTGSGFLSSTDILSMNTDAIVTVNGSQAIDMRWLTSGGTAQAQGYGLVLIKLNN